MLERRRHNALSNVSARGGTEQAGVHGRGGRGLGEGFSFSAFCFYGWSRIPARSSAGWIDEVFHDGMMHEEEFCVLAIPITVSWPYRLFAGGVLHVNTSVQVAASIDR